MIVWLSSYPKSGNTYLRALLSSYIFSEDGIFNFGLLKKFIQFPNKFIFEKLGLNISDDLELARNYIKAQEFINQMVLLTPRKGQASKVCAVLILNNVNACPQEKFSG